MSKIVSNEVCKKLRKCGAKFDPYVKSPVAGSDFIVSIQNGKLIMVHATDVAKLHINVSKKHKQVLVVAKENARTLRINSTHTINNPSYFIKNWKDKPTRGIHNHSINRSQLTIPGAKTKVITNIPGKEVIAMCRSSIKEIKKKGNPSHRYVKELYPKIPITYQVDAPQRTNTVLMGIDETAHFVCMPPKGVKTIEEAHEALRPAKIPKGSQRQGEFFFIPATEGQVEAIGRQFKTAPRTSIPSRYRGITYLRKRSGGIEFTPLETGSSHYATCVVRIKKRTFACGAVMDTRQNRHKCVVLDGWNEVIRNKELSVPKSMEVVSRYWD